MDNGITIPASLAAAEFASTYARLEDHPKYRRAGDDLKSSAPSLRDTFAAAALQGMLADPNTGSVDVTESEFPHLLARRSFQYADAMVKARGEVKP